jgi:hypothetical protein
MNKNIIRLIVLLTLFGALILLFTGLSGKSDDVIDQVVTDEALMLAQNYVGLIPARQDTGSALAGPETTTLSIEIAGRNMMMFATEILYIMPPGELISSNSEFTFESGTQVKLYFVTTTPPPVSDPDLAPVQYQTASFLDFDGKSMDLIMDRDKTIRIGYMTLVFASQSDAMEHQLEQSPSQIADVN